MSEPIVYVGIGFLFAVALVICAIPLAFSRVGRRTIRRFETAAPMLMSDIEADMGQLHAQIAVATRRLEVSVEQMKARTTSQLCEIGRSSEAIGRLKAELSDKTVALQALTAKERELIEQLRVAEAELGVKTRALREVERKLAKEKAELEDLMAFVDARDKLAETERRHAAALDAVKAENAQLVDELAKAREESNALIHEMAALKRQIEGTWASERMASALLRERINDVAGEVVRVAHALEGLGSPIDSILAGQAAELDASSAAAGGNGGRPAGDDSKGTLALRLRSLQKRSQRVSSSGGT